MENQISPSVARAARLVIKEQKCSTSFIQRQLTIGYNAAAVIVETLEKLGVVSKPDHIGKREILMVELTASLTAAFATVEGSPDPQASEPKDQVTDALHNNPAGAEIRSFIERYERLEAEKKDISDAQKEVMAEAKGRGYDTKVLRKIVALRKRDENDVAEEEATMDMYMSSMGM